MEGHYINWQVWLDVTWLILLVLILRNFLKDILTLKTVQKWSAIKGEVESMELVEVGQNYWPKLIYRYEVAGEAYLGNSIFVDSYLNSPHSGYSKQVAYRLASAYKEGNPVDVYYDPKAPDLAVLDTRIPPKLFVVAAILGAMIVVQFVLMIYKVWG